MIKARCHSRVFFIVLVFGIWVWYNWYLGEQMNDNTKIEVAREVMNAMIGKYGKNGYDKSNAMLMTLLKDEEEMNKFNFEVIDKIIHIYGPMVDGESK